MNEEVSPAVIIIVAMVVFTVLIATYFVAVPGRYAAPTTQGALTTTPSLAPPATKTTADELGRSVKTAPDSAGVR